MANHPKCLYCGGVIVYQPYTETIAGTKYSFHAKQCAIALNSMKCGYCGGSTVYEPYRETIEKKGSERMQCLNRIASNMTNMPTSKVNRNYQVTIPKDVRRKAGIDKGDTVMIQYDENEDTILINPPKRGKRKTWVLGKKLSVDEIEAGIEKGQLSK